MKRVTLVSYEQMLETAQELKAATRGEIALCGGWAMHCYGSDRLTKDVDVIAKEPPALPEVGSLSFGGYQVEVSTGVPVDVIIRDDEYSDLYEEALEQAVSLPGVPIPVVSPEYLVVLKILAARGKDNLDLEFLLVSELVDLQAVRKLIRKFLGRFVVKEFDATLAEVRWRAGKST